jgi:hypothetical protein
MLKNLVLALCIWLWLFTTVQAEYTICYVGESNTHWPMDYAEAYGLLTEFSNKGVTVVNKACAGAFISHFWKYTAANPDTVCPNAYGATMQVLDSLDGDTIFTAGTTWFEQVVAVNADMYVLQFLQNDLLILANTQRHPHGISDISYQLMKLIDDLQAEVPTATIVFQRNMPWRQVSCSYIASAYGEANWDWYFGSACSTSYAACDSIETCGHLGNQNNNYIWDTYVKSGLAQRGIKYFDGFAYAEAYWGSMAAADNLFDIASPDPGVPAGDCAIHPHPVILWNWLHRNALYYFLGWQTSINNGVKLQGGAYLK